jgi:hypothetical protein
VNKSKLASMEIDQALQHLARLVPLIPRDCLPRFESASYELALLSGYLSAFPGDRAETQSQVSSPPISPTGFHAHSDVGTRHGLECPRCHAWIEFRWDLQVFECPDDNGTHNGGNPKEAA